MVDLTISHLLKSAIEFEFEFEFEEQMKKL